MASASLGSLVLELAASTAKFSSDLGRAAVIAQNQARRISRALSAVGIALPVTAVVALGVALVSGLVKAAKFGDEIRKASAKTGTTTKAIQELAFAAKQSDVDLGSLTTALKKMQVSLSEAGSGAKAPLAALAALGLKLADLQKLSPDVQFERIGDAISRLKDPADRARAATELFGRAGADLLPIFENGAGAIRKMRKEAEQIGAVLSDKDIQKLAEANSSITKFTTSFTGLWHTVAALVTPELAKFFDVLRRGLGGSTERELEIEKLQRQLLGLSGGASKGGAGAFSRQANAARIEQLTAQIKFLQAGAVGAVGTPHAPTTARGHPLTPPPGFGPDAEAGAKSVNDLLKKQRDFQESLGKTEIERLMKSIDLEFTQAEAIDGVNKALERALGEQAAFSSGGDAAVKAYDDAADAAETAAAAALSAAGSYTEFINLRRELGRKVKDTFDTRNALELDRAIADVARDTRFAVGELGAYRAGGEEAVRAFDDAAAATEKFRQISVASGVSVEDLAAHFPNLKKNIEDALGAQSALAKSQQFASDLNSALSNAFTNIESGLKGMVRAFIQAFEQILAQRFAQKLAEQISGALANAASSSSGGFFSGLIRFFTGAGRGGGGGGGGGRLLGPVFGATGADFIVGGKSGKDANVVPMHLTKGERVQVTPAGRWGNDGAGKFFGAAKGADFTVGGRSGVDTNVVAFRATRGERVVVTPPGKKSKKTSFDKLLEGLPGFARGADFTVGGVKDKESTRDKVATISKSGTDFTVTGRSGVDANVVAFRATKGERVVVTPPGPKRRSHLLDDLPGFAKGGSFTVGNIKGMDAPWRTSRASRDDPKAKSSSAPVINYSPIYHIAPGVTRQELLPLLQRTHQQSISDMSELIRRGRFA